MLSMHSNFSFAICAVLVACGPAPRNNNGLDSAGQCVPTAVENTPALCSDGIDNDCSGHADCTDPSCSGIGGCPVCGTVQHPLSTPLALPDGVGGVTCTSDTMCASVQPGPQLCFPIIGECRETYTSKLHFDGFPQNLKFAAVSNIQSVCFNAEHSWLRDLQIDLVSPSGQKVQLQKMLGQMGSEIYLGHANDCDDATNPVPGMGLDYCWKPTATNPAMLAFADGGGTMTQVTGCDGLQHDMMPIGDYSAADPWTNLLGSDLNGDWKIEVTDLWPDDNGFIFSWSIAFDSHLVTSCDPPIQ
jgi:hypothetical protein